MRSVVRVSEGFPELQEDLLRIPERFRADRLRVLASIGLAALNGQLPQTTGERIERPAASGVSESEEKGRQEMSGAIGSVLGSLNEQSKP